MTELYPLLLKPQFRERIWGTRDLSPIYGEVPGTEPIGEVWLTGDECEVANGPLAGTSLADLCRRYGRDLVGDTAREADRFPLLIKFLFPREKLSVQVHPDDEAARRMGQPCGKTECWYVLKADPGARIALGLKSGATREQFAQAIREVRAEQLLNWVAIHAGEMFYVDAGTVHAIGPGSILVETQQNSDTTFRLYDYGRPRELHVEQGLRAMKETTRAGKVQAHGDILILCRHFVVEHQSWSNEDRQLSPQYCEKAEGGGPWPSMRIFVAVSGCGVFETRGQDPVSFMQGEVVVVPATVEDFDLRAQWDLEFLRMTLPPAGEFLTRADKKGLLTGGLVGAFSQLPSKQ